MNDTGTSANGGQKRQEQTAKSIKLKIGNIFSYVGLLGLPLGFGMVLGFYAADRGARWLPTMLEIFLVICVVSLAAIIFGRILEGTAVKLTAKGIRLRRRVIVCLVLAGLAILARLGLYWAEQPSPLTELPPARFNEAFRMDMSRYRQYDESIGRQLELIESRSGMFNPVQKRTLTADEEKFVRDIWTTIYDYAFALDQIRVFYEDWYRFDPSRVQRSYHIRSFLLTFAAELSLYEKSTRLIQLVTQNPNAVKFLNTPHSDSALPENSFSKFREQLQSSRDQARVVAGRQYLLWLEKGLKGREETKALGCQWLWNKVESELALIDATGTVELARLSVSSDLEILKRAVDRVWFPAQQGVARWMGQTRMKRIGKYLITTEQLHQMDKLLEPGDIVLSRKNWYLSNVGLPGFWPHAILYIGSPEKFEAYFNDQQVLAYLKEISGENITLGQYLAKRYSIRWLTYKLGNAGEQFSLIEAISPGIVLNTLKGARGDYMAAVRPRLDKKAKAQAVIEVFSHLGKPYDFDFDFATDHALVCTELVWRSYRPAADKEGLNFELMDIAGRKTLPANEIAKLYAQQHGRPDAQLDFVCFIDAREKSITAFFSTEQAFLKSHTRAKWCFALD